MFFPIVEDTPWKRNKISQVGLVESCPALHLMDPGSNPIIDQGFHIVQVFSPHFTMCTWEVFLPHQNKVNISSYNNLYTAIVIIQESF